MPRSGIRITSKLGAPSYPLVQMTVPGLASPALYILPSGAKKMKAHRKALGLLVVVCALALTARILRSQEKSSPSTVQVHMVVTDQALADNTEVPALTPQTVQVKQGKNVLKVDQLIPAQGENAALQLFILVDDTCDPVIGTNLDDIREFVNSQPATTLVGVAYMSNATIQITQNFTADHALVAKALRLPRGNLSTMDSPYLSLISLVKSWPQQKVRREVLMVTDGIDRLRGASSAGSQMSSRGLARPAFSSPSYTMPTISPDADTASTNSQRYQVIVHSIYAVGVGRVGRNAWEAQLGQSGIAKIAEETGGEYFALGTQNAVSFKPYLERLQKIFNSQYYLVFQAVPRKNDGLQRVDISTQVPNVDLASADSVWVPSGK